VPSAPHVGAPEPLPAAPGPPAPEVVAPPAPPAVFAAEELPPPRAEEAAGPSPEPPAATDATGRDPEALIEAGDAALAAGDAARALALFERAIALDSHDPYGHAGAARACLALARAEDAVRFAERAVAHRRRRASFRVLLGDALSAAGDTARARREWERALELDPDDETGRARLGR
jgi:tetratricopeptide (TPR) repeat protein